MYSSSSCCEFPFGGKQRERQRKEGLTPTFLYQIRVILGHTLLLAHKHPSPSEERQHMAGHQELFVQDLMI